MQWLFLIILIPYLYLITKVYFSLKRIVPFHPESGDHNLFISVVVACHNEEKALPLLLSDIADQTCNPDQFELIIIDDNSSDATAEIACSYGMIRNLKVLANPGKGKKSALRKGIDESNGSFIVTADADCRFGKNWLKTIAEFQNEYNPDMIICPVKLSGGIGFFHRFQELEFLGLQGITAGTTIEDKPVMCNGANLAFLKETYNEYRGNLHDELFSGDDVFLLHNIKKDPGKRILWLESAEAIATTSTSDTLASFIDQRARWISKAGAYRDSYTILLAVVTFITILVQASLLFFGLFFVNLLWIFIGFFILKSVPDFLVLSNIAGRYGKRSLLRWFLPSQLIYPFYVIGAVTCSVVNRRKWSG